MKILSYGEFKDYLDILTSRIKGGVETECDEAVAKMYYTSVATKLSAEQLMAKFTKLFEEWDQYRLPTPQEWLNIDVEAPKINSQAYRPFQVIDGGRNAALPPARSQRSPEETKRNLIALLAGVYKCQGDRGFYRKMLEGRQGYWSNFSRNLTGHSGAITHHEVMEEVRGVARV